MDFCSLSLLYSEVWVLVLRTVPAAALDLLPAMPRRLPSESALEEQAGGEHDATGGGGERAVTSQRLKENKNRLCPVTCGTDKFVKWKKNPLVLHSFNS